MVVRCFLRRWRHLVCLLLSWKFWGILVERENMKGSATASMTTSMRKYIYIYIIIIFGLTQSSWMCSTKFFFLSFSHWSLVWESSRTEVNILKTSFNSKRVHITLLTRDNRPIITLNNLQSTAFWSRRSYFLHTLTSRQIFFLCPSFYSGSDEDVNGFNGTFW